MRHAGNVRAPDRELAILVACRETNYNLEWNAHEPAAVKAAFALVGSWGLAKFHDFFKRLHGPSKATTLPSGTCRLTPLSTRITWL